ncbi:MAG: hypothetical protein HOH33_09595 [Verrucomicrobia bacterium]|jgi:type II secretory pathway component PulF|nr:hypothetical protein [Verrucomicrobiota bacterium]
MAFLLNAGHSAQQSEFYHQLGTMCEAGLTLPQSLETLDRSKGFGSYQRRLKSWREAIGRGETFGEAVAHSKGDVPDFDLALLYAGENSGRLDDCFRSLSEYYKKRADNIRESRGILAYPAFVFHFAVLIIPFPTLFQTGNVAAYLSSTLGILIPVYVLLFALSWAFNGTRALAWRRMIEAVLRFVPFLGAALKSLALSKFCLALESLLNAGVSVSGAWTTAAQASGSPALLAEVKSFPEAMDRGSTPSEWLETASFFPELFKMSYTNGETSGRLDENLTRLRKVYDQEGNRKLRMFSQWLPRLIYLGMVVALAYYIVSFWTGYYDGVLDSVDI